METYSKATSQKTPLWVGTLRLEEANHPLPLVTLFLETNTKEDIVQQFSNALKNTQTHVQTHLIHSNNVDTPEVLLLRSP